MRELQTVRGIEYPTQPANTFGRLAANATWDYWLKIEVSEIVTLPRPMHEPRLINGLKAYQPTVDEWGSNIVILGSSRGTKAKPEADKDAFMFRAGVLSLLGMPGAEVGSLMISALVTTRLNVDSHPSTGSTVSVIKA